MSQGLPSGESRDEQLVEVWVNTLTGEGVESTAGGLIAALASQRLHLRTGAAIVLGRRGEAAAIPHLKTLLRDPSPVVQVEAAMSLVLLGDRSGVPALIEALDGELLTGAPVTAARYLAGLGDPRGYKVVMKALSSDLGGIRLTAAVALKNFVPYHGKEIDGQKIDLFTVVERALKDSEPMVRRELLYKIVLLDDPRRLALLSAISHSDSDEVVRQTAQQLLSQMH